MKIITEILSEPMVVLLALALIQTLILSFLISLLLVRLAIQAARKYSVLAHPSARGSHDTPIPRLGGLGIAGAFYLTTILMYRWAPRLDPQPWVAAVFIGGAYALIGGLLDDVLGLSPKWKFLFQFAAAGAALFLGFGIPGVSLPDGRWLMLSPMIGSVITFAFIIFMMNAYNFMDGMDGQAALFGVIVCAAIFFALALQPRMDLVTGLIDILVIATLAGSLAGFLTYNMPQIERHAKCFMGDSGSQLVGFLLALAALRMDEAGREAMPFLAVLILLSPFVWDVCFTLVRRLGRGENILQAHRSHLYQNLLVAGWTHGQVLALNALLWLSCAVLSHVYAFAHREMMPMLAWSMMLATGGLLVLYTGFVLAVTKGKPAAQ